MTETGWKDRLSRYVYLKHEYYSLLDRLARLENDTQIPAMKEENCSQRSLLKSSRMERAAVRKMEQEKQICARLDRIEAEMDAVEDAINCLDNPLHREVLRLRYTDCEGLRLTPWEDVTMKLYGSNAEKEKLAVWRVYNAALKELEKQKSQGDI